MEAEGCEGREAEMEGKLKHRMDGGRTSGEQ